MTSPLDEKAEITVGMRVEKFTGEARWFGVVVSEYQTTRGMRRFVVDVEPQGFQMIAVPSQLRPALSSVALPDELEVVAWRYMIWNDREWRFGKHYPVGADSAEPLVTLSQAHSTIAALRAKIGQAELREGALMRDCEVYKDHAADQLERAVTAEAEVKRLTEENEALRAERGAALSLMETALLSADPNRHIRAAIAALNSREKGDA